jgi:hypothetical protein
MADPKPGTGALLGKQWQPRDLARIFYNAGFQDAVTLTVALQVCLAESQGYDHAIHVNLDGSRDRGVWQLNSIHKQITDEIAYDPVKATDEAFKLWVARGSDFSDWAAYTTGVYLHDSYLGRATRGVANYLADELLTWPVPKRADGSTYEHRFTSPVLSYQHQTAGAIHYLEQAKKHLGFGAKSKDVVLGVQKDISNGLIAAKQALPN